MKLAYLAFSEQGYALAKSIADKLGGQVSRSGCPDESGKAYSLQEWTDAHFSSCDGLVFVGAMGIAVRAIAPFAKDKTTDPAVVVLDEKALHVIPVLSGHLGGANDLARRIAEITGGDPVITTATDVNGIFAVDEWSKHQNCVLLDPKKIVGISGGLLGGSTVSVYSPWHIEGTVPNGLRVVDSPESADVILDIKAYSGDLKNAGPGALQLVPRICTLGIGCRKGTTAEAIETQFAQLLEMTGIRPESIVQAASIDLKKNEPGLLAFCQKHGWSLHTYSDEELRNVEGDFSPSAFVQSVTGVDNVCERSALLAAMQTPQPGCTARAAAEISTAEILSAESLPAEILQKKFAGNGVTLALAATEYRPTWTWR